MRADRIYTVCLLGRIPLRLSPNIYQQISARADTLYIVLFYYLGVWYSYYISFRTSPALQAKWIVNRTSTRPNAPEQAPPRLLEPRFRDAGKYGPSLPNYPVWDLGGSPTKDGIPKKLHRTLPRCVGNPDIFVRLMTP